VVRVKICGLKNKEDARAAALYGADAVGLVFARSPRRVDVATAREISAALPPFVHRVGVFVDEQPEAVRDVANACGLTMLQFHGSEDAVYCRLFTLPVLKAVRVRTGEDLQGLELFPAAGFVLDTHHPVLRGGSGETFDWSLLEGLPDVPVILAGGLHPGNVAEAVRQVKPYGVDVSSGVETGGEKDREKIRAFIMAARRQG